MTIRALSSETAKEYIVAKPGFTTEIEDGRLWVLKGDQKKDEKRISFIGAGPMGMTIYAQDKDTVLAYLAQKPGFITEVEDGRLWVLKGDQKKDEKRVTLIGAGPMGVSILAESKDTALEYLASTPGFETFIKDGRLWVLKDGEKESEKHITLIGAGPMGLTVKAVDRNTANAYLAAIN
jgi:NADPH-dependent glutamate synthase beta subunit-like oxidoreductase